jgi:hypothetical protein
MVSKFIRESCLNQGEIKVKSSSSLSLLLVENIQHGTNSFFFATNVVVGRDDVFGDAVGNMGAMVGDYAIGFELKQGLSDIANDGVAA